MSNQNNSDITGYTYTKTSIKIKFLNTQIFKRFYYDL